METWDIYDINRVKTGNVLEQGKLPEWGQFFLIVHVCVFNSEGRLLIQKRHESKRAWPGIWDISVSGHTMSGENTQQSAMREAKEELGLDIDLSERAPQISFSFHYGFDDFFLVVKDVDIKDVVLQPTEVSEVKWASKDEIKGMIDNAEFIPYHHSMIDIIFDMREQTNGPYNVEKYKKLMEKSGLKKTVSS